VRVSLCLVLGACSYTPPGATPVDAPKVDAPVDAIDAPVTVDSLPPSGLCDRPGTDLRLCLLFDNDAFDRSGHGNDPQQATGIVYMPAPDNVGAVVSAAHIVIPVDNSLDVTTFSIKMWVRPTTLPALGQRMGLIDNDAYRMFVLPGGQIRCAINGASPHEVITVGTIQANASKHINCQFNGSSLRVSADGVDLGGSVPFPADTLRQISTSTTIGQSEPANDSERFDGLLDTVQVFGTVQP
jgi:hypothetical protein